MKEALGNKSELDVAMIGSDLSADGLAVVIRLAVQVLVAAHALQRCHGRHPKVIGVRAEDAEGLFERDFDFDLSATRTVGTQAVGDAGALVWVAEQLDLIGRIDRACGNLGAKGNWRECAQRGCMPRLAP